jgi:hypothetical protein
MGTERVPYTTLSASGFGWDLGTSTVIIVDIRRASTEEVSTAALRLGLFQEAYNDPGHMELRVVLVLGGVAKSPSPPSIKEK